MSSNGRVRSQRLVTDKTPKNCVHETPGKNNQHKTAEFEGILFGVISSSLTFAGNFFI